MSINLDQSTPASLGCGDIGRLALWRRMAAYFFFEGASHGVKALADNLTQKGSQ